MLGNHINVANLDFVFLAPSALQFVRVRYDIVWQNMELATRLLNLPDVGFQEGNNLKRTLLLNFTGSKGRVGEKKKIWYSMENCAG